MDLLKGIRVLDLTRLYPGPFCTMLLADMGAEVIKVESPSEGDYMRLMGPMDGELSLYFRLLNRNKKSMTLNLKKQEGVELFLRLAREADVVVEGFRPGVVEALGIGYQAVQSANPEIIYCSISGYGQDGPYRERAGHDINYIALAGILGLTGSKEGPPVVPSVQIGDVGGGSQMAVMSILAALLARFRGGGGRYLDVAMLDGLVAWLPLAAAELFAGRSAERGGMMLNGGVACYGVYRTADDGYMSLGALEPKFWAEFCRAVGREDLAAQQYQPDQKSLQQEVAAIFSSRSRREWEEIFGPVDACCEPVLGLAEAFAHLQSQARGLLGSQVLAFPVKISGQDRRPDGPSPCLGQHTQEVLRAACYTEQEIALLVSQGIV
ncbi:MAG: CoA transferase [Firmicutes bacterium]|nr:CoA transferase [Bacillota bacterium]